MALLELVMLGSIGKQSIQIANMHEHSFTATVLSLLASRVIFQPFPDHADIKSEEGIFLGVLAEIHILIVCGNFGVVPEACGIGRADCVRGRY